MIKVARRVDEAPSSVDELPEEAEAARRRETRSAALASSYVCNR